MSICLGKFFEVTAGEVKICQLVESCTSPFESHQASFGDVMGAQRLSTFDFAKSRSLVAEKAVWGEVTHNCIGYCSRKSYLVKISCVFTWLCSHGQKKLLHVCSFYLRAYSLQVASYCQWLKMYIIWSRTFEILPFSLYLVFKVNNWLLNVI